MCLDETFPMFVTDSNPDSMEKNQRNFKFGENGFYYFEVGDMEVFEWSFEGFLLFMS
jgi:hypothetical protein